MSIANRPRPGKLEGRSEVGSSPALPKHVLVGYWHNWDSNAAPFVPLRDVSDHFDIINIAFAAPAERSDGQIAFAPHGGVTAKHFESDVAHLQAAGKKVLISIGGAAGSSAVDNPAAQDAFSTSVVDIIRRYGFDGLDVNLEGTVRLEAGDLDYRKPTSASVRHLIAAIRDVRSSFGSEFILSLAPETVNVQGGSSMYAGLAGSYLPVIHDLRDILAYVQVQHYNSAALATPHGDTYLPGNADFHAAAADMLLRGFPIQGDPNLIFPPLSPRQLVIGLAAWPAAVRNGYTAPPEVEKVLGWLMAGEPLAGTYRSVSPTSYPALRGVMTWSINWDAANYYRFSDTIRACLDALP